MMAQDAPLLPLLLFVVASYRLVSNFVCGGGGGVGTPVVCLLLPVGSVVLPACIGWCR